MLKGWYELHKLEPTTSKRLAQLAYMVLKCSCFTLKIVGSSKFGNEAIKWW